jgi:hypothetical protein
MKISGSLGVMGPKIHFYSCLVLKQCSWKENRRRIIRECVRGFIYLQGKAVRSRDDVVAIDKCS